MKMQAVRLWKTALHIIVLYGALPAAAFLWGKLVPLPLFKVPNRHYMLRNGAKKACSRTKITV